MRNCQFILWTQTSNFAASLTEEHAMRAWQVGGALGLLSGFVQVVQLAEPHTAAYGAGMIVGATVFGTALGAVVGWLWRLGKRRA